MESTLLAPSEPVLAATGPTAKRSKARDDPFDWFLHDVTEIVPTSSDTFDNATANEISSYKKEAQERGSSILDPFRW